jgi:hypothetical protein
VCAENANRLQAEKEERKENICEPKSQRGNYRNENQIESRKVTIVNLHQQIRSTKEKSVPCAQYSP